MIRDLVKSDANILHHEINLVVDRHFIAKTLIENMIYYEGVGLSETRCKSICYDKRYRA